VRTRRSLDLILHPTKKFFACATIKREREIVCGEREGVFSQVGMKMMMQMPWKWLKRTHHGGT